MKQIMLLDGGMGHDPFRHLKALFVSLFLTSYKE